MAKYVNALIVLKSSHLLIHINNKYSSELETEYCWLQLVLSKWPAYILLDRVLIVNGPLGPRLGPASLLILNGPLGPRLVPASLLIMSPYGHLTKQTTW